MRPLPLVRDRCAPGTRPTVTDRLLGAAEVAGILGVSRRWVEDATRRGEIPSVRLGRFYRYRAESIAAWVEEAERAGSRGRRVQARGTR